MSHCDRCGLPCVGTIVSMFNTETICLPCQKKESEHPMYEAARKAEREAVRQGNYNFPGVGKPEDL